MELDRVNRSIVEKGKEISEKGGTPTVVFSFLVVGS